MAGIPIGRVTNSDAAQRKPLMAIARAQNMPELWLNYGAREVVMDIRAENLDKIIAPKSQIWNESDIASVLKQIELQKSPALVLLQDTKAVRTIVSTVYNICEKRSLSFPKIMAAHPVRQSIRGKLSEGAVVDSFKPDANGPDTNLIFVAEAETDGLFGYDTVCTKLLRIFGGEDMLTTYEKRDGDKPKPAQKNMPYQMARRFVDKFDVASIDVAAGQQGISNIVVGHPSACKPHVLTSGYRTGTSRFAQTIIGSTGRHSDNDTLASSLRPLWVLQQAVTDGGQAILLAECSGGLGSDALIQLVEGQLDTDALRRPNKYVDGMEDVLFLDTVLNDAKSNGTKYMLVSALPDMYAISLNLKILRRAQEAVDQIVSRHARRKLSILPDTGRTILRKKC